jgi:hypothetical protein
MYVIVCGGRYYRFSITDSQWLFDLHQKHHFTEVIVGSDKRDKHGRLLGADACAYEWARAHGIDRTLMDANWVGQGKPAGPRRNGRMLRYLMVISDYMGAPRAVVAFPGATGTADMIAQAIAAKVQVFTLAA